METKKVTAPEHDFVLVLIGLEAPSTDVENALFDAGCDDATLSFRAGRAYLSFSRSAPSLAEAILSAIADVRKAIVGVDVLRVDQSDLVAQAEIARRIGRTRQLVHQYVTGARGPGRFPPPVCQLSEGDPLWEWSEVAEWLSENDMVTKEVARQARQVAVINTILALRQSTMGDPELVREIGSRLISRRDDNGETLKTVDRESRDPSAVEIEKMTVAREGRDPSAVEIEKMITEASHVAAVAGPQAGFLLAWACLEAAMRKVLQEMGFPAVTLRMPLKDLTEQLRETGFLGQQICHYLQESGRLRGQIAHGFVTQPFAEQEVSLLLSLAKRLLNKFTASIK